MNSSKYQRLMLIACLDTLTNLPMIIIVLATSISEGKNSAVNFPYVSWKNVHDGIGGLAPGQSLSSIIRIPASDWSTSTFAVFQVKWNEWLFVLLAVIFFGVFGTTPEMRQYYRSALWFIPERLGLKKRRVSEVETVWGVAFNSNPGQGVQDRPAKNRRRGSLSFLESTVEMSGSRSPGIAEASNTGVMTSRRTVQSSFLDVDGDLATTGSGQGNH